MPEQIRVVPRPGLIVRSPEHDLRPLPPEGAQVTASLYWRERARDGDVTIEPLDAGEAPDLPLEAPTRTRTARRT